MARRWREIRALMRVELRELRRHPGRTLLLLLLVAVPVAAVVGGGCLVRITERTPEEYRAQVMGQADLRVDLAREQEAGAVGTRLPASARTEAVSSRPATVMREGRRLRIGLLVARPESVEPGGLLQGWLRVSGGRAPREPGEVALARGVLDGLGADVGSRVVLEGFGGARGSRAVPGHAEVVVCGVVERPEALDAPVGLVVHGGEDGTGSAAGADPLDRADPGSPSRQQLFLALSQDGNTGGTGSAPVAAALREAGYRVAERSAVGSGDGLLTAMVLALGSIGFLEAALVIAAAFAIGLQRRRREIGLLSAGGATAGGLRAAVLGSAGALAVAGGVLGTAMGVGAAAALHPFLDAWNQRRNGPFEVPGDIVAVAVLMGVAAATAAAVVPARGAARLSLKDALGGRRPSRSRGRLALAVGLAMVLGGIGLLLVASTSVSASAGAATVAGSVLGVLGFGVCSPWLLDGLARRAGRLPLAWRLAVRDAGRFHGRNGAVVTAVLAGMSMSVTLAVLLGSVEQALDAQPKPYRDDQMLIEGPGAASVADALAGWPEVLAAAPLRAALVDGVPARAVQLSGNPAGESVGDRSGHPAAGRSGAGEWIACGGPDLVRALAGEDPVEVRVLTGSGEALPGTVPAYAVSGDQTVRGPRYVLEERVARERGWSPAPPPGWTVAPWMVRTKAPVTRDLVERARATAAGIAGTSVDAALLHERPARRFVHLALGLCALTGMVLVFMATGLASAESAGDVRVLHTVGAPPAVMRAHAAARAGYLALLGCVLAVPAGFVPVLGLVRAANLPVTIAVPWMELLLVAVGMPAVVYGLLWLRGERAPAGLPRG